MQRYTSVKTPGESKKVAYLFTILYLVSPFIWMLPPMVYRIMNPDLAGLGSEGAYMMLCQKILPSGLIGLVLAGMISATSSKANTTINLEATVFATDLYKNFIRKNAGEKVEGVVGTLMTNLAVEQAIQAEGILFERAKVGDRYVLEKLKEKNWLLGGEGSGHLICLDKHTTGDGIVAALQVLSAMKQSYQSLAELLQKVSLFPQTLKIVS